MTCDTSLPRPVLPRRIRKKDQRWHKGLFVAANVQISDTGEPLFGQVNSDWTMQAAIERTCQLCGQHISTRTPCVFPGGPNDYRYDEAPLHIECARYSMLVCPNILSKRANYTFHVCMTYDVMHFGITREGALIIDGAVPKNLRQGSSLILSLYMAHPVDKKTYELSCGHRHVQRLSFDEFLDWSQ